MWTHLALALAMVLHCRLSYESKGWEMIPTVGYMEPTHLMTLFVAKVVNKSVVLERSLAGSEHDMHSPSGLVLTFHLKQSHGLCSPQ